MVLVEADTVIAELIHLLPGFEMLGIGAHRDVGLEVAAGERVGELAADLEMVELFAIGEQVEDEDFHARFPVTCRWCGRYGVSSGSAKPREKISHMWKWGPQA